MDSMYFFCAKDRQAQTIRYLNIDHRAERARVYQYFSTYRAGPFFISRMHPGARDERTAVQQTLWRQID
jgi:hypothetical protein